MQYSMQPTHYTHYVIAENPFTIGLLSLQSFTQHYIYFVFCNSLRNGAAVQFIKKWDFVSLLLKLGYLKKMFSMLRVVDNNYLLCI